MEIVQIDVTDLIPYARNARTHSDAQVAQIAASVREFGFNNPILLRDDKTIIAGHGRVLAAQKLGLDSLPCVFLSHLTETQARAYVLADNQLAVKAGWDADMLALELDELKTAGIAADLMGFSDKDLKAILGAVKVADESDAEPQIDRGEELREKWGVEFGQLWKLGDHLLLCGDSTSGGDVQHLMNGERADVCLTDPPYGLGSGKKSGKNDYDQHQDTRENLESLAEKWLPIARSMCDCVVFSPGVTNAWIYPEASWIMCWFYGGGQLRSSWGFNCWQPFLCYGKDPSLASGNGARPDAVNMNTPSNASELGHPCPKPTKLWVWFIERLTFTGKETIYEPFSGSGTTIIACEQLGRKCRAIEISPAYVAIAIQRWADATGKTPERVDG